MHETLSTVRWMIFRIIDDDFPFQRLFSTASNYSYKIFAIYFPYFLLGRAIFLFPFTILK